MAAKMMMSGGAMEKSMGKPKTMEKSGNAKPSSMSHGKAKLGSPVVKDLKK